MRTQRSLLVFVTLAVTFLTAPATAAPCLIVTVTGAQGGPQAYQGQAGPGTLIRYGDDANDCNAMRLQFDAGRGTYCGCRRSASSPRRSTPSSSRICTTTTARALPI